MIRGILFDFNGTMFFDGPKHKKAWNHFSLQYRGKPISDEEMDKTHGQTNHRIIQILMGEQISEEENEKLSKAKEALYRDICRNEPDSFHLVKGLPEVLDTLKKMKVPMTICSASIKENIDFFISSFQLDKWFCREDIVYDDGVHLNKISMFEDGAKKIGVPLHECLIIEDSFSGIAFAHACGAGKIIAITTPEREEEYRNLPGVDEIIHDFTNFDTFIFSKKI